MLSAAQALKVFTTSGSSDCPLIMKKRLSEKAAFFCIACPLDIVWLLRRLAVRKAILIKNRKMGYFVVKKSLVWG